MENKFEAVTRIQELARELLQTSAAYQVTIKEQSAGVRDGTYTISNVATTVRIFQARVRGISVELRALTKGL